jgi:hypothetical protein
MSLSEIRFTPSLLVDLYKDSLVSIQEGKQSKSAKKSAQTEQPPRKFLGKNLRNILIVVNKESAIFLPDDELNLLTKMLSACNLTLADVAIVNVAGSNVSVEQLVVEFEPARMLLLGSTFHGEFSNLANTEYLVQQHKDYSYFFAPDLKDMLGETASARSIKTKLWGALKQMFAL